MSMSYFICPICKENFIISNNSCKCSNNHCFDISRKGTVNLLRSQKSSHGDDKIMVNARRDFLNKGYYTPLLNQLKEQVLSVASDPCTILDCGCGECWYTAGIYEHLQKNGIRSDFLGIDVSKNAIIAGAGRNKELKLAVATVFDIPMANNSCDIILSLFAPFSPQEYIRLLKEKGFFITTFPLEEHLWELKKAVYEKPYKNEVSDMKIEGFELIQNISIHEYINLKSTEDILSLFSMTPYYYKTSQNDKAKLEKLETLKTQIHFCVAVYRKVT